MGDYLMSIIKANDIQNASGGIPTVKSQQLIPTAWVNFNGTSTVAIRASENVSSITDNGTGDYSANFAVAMANSNYSALSYMSGGGDDALYMYMYSATTSGIRMGARTARTSGKTDASTVTAVVMGGQS